MANILLIITGSIAAVKTPDLVRGLRAGGHNVTCVLTKSAEQFVGALALASLSENKIYTELFDLNSEVEMSHIALSRKADVVLVAPASANFIAKMANGLCDDLASTVYMAADKPVIVAPAMNTKMYEHPAFKRNLALLKKDGVMIIPAKSGKLACGEDGFGKMEEVANIIKYVDKFLSKNGKLSNSQKLSGVKCLVTSGPTRENIDPVRYISNHSSGKQGHAIAKALAEAGAEVFLVSGPTNLETPENVKLIEVESAHEMLNSCMKLLPVDVAICAAAVADWKVDAVSAQKIKKMHDGQIQILSLIENPDILRELSRPSKNRPKLVVGFAAETEHLIENAMVKMERKGCDWIVANNVAKDKVFGSDKNSVIIITPEKHEVLNAKLKEEVAGRLANMIAEKFLK